MYGGVVLKLQQRGLCYRKYVDHALNHAQFCMHGNNLLVKPVCVNVLKKKKGSTGFGNSSSIDRSLPFLSSPLANMEL